MVACACASPFGRHCSAGCACSVSRAMLRRCGAPRLRLLPGLGSAGVEPRPPRKMGSPTVQTPQPSRAGVRSRHTVAIFLVSLAGLLLEVGYTRVISYKLWYYYTYLVIGLALLGIGSGGIFVVVVPRLRRAATDSILAACSLVGAVIIAVGYVVVARIPIDTVRIWVYGSASSYKNLGVLAFVCFVLFASFIALGIIVATLLGPRRRPRRWPLLRRPARRRSRVPLRDPADREPRSARGDHAVGADLRGRRSRVTPALTGAGGRCRRRSRRRAGSVRNRSVRTARRADRGDQRQERQRRVLGVGPGVSRRRRAGLAQGVAPAARRHVGFRDVHVQRRPVDIDPLQVRSPRAAVPYPRRTARRRADHRLRGRKRDPRVALLRCASHRRRRAEPGDGLTPHRPLRRLQRPPRRPARRAPAQRRRPQLSRA